MEFAKRQIKKLRTFAAELNFRGFNCGEWLTRTSCYFSRCDLCGRENCQYRLICQYCLDDLPRFNQPISTPNLLQWPAIERALAPIKFEKLVCVAPYIWPFNKWISQLKYQGRVELSDLLSLFMTITAAPVIQPYSKQSIAIVAVPLNIRKWQQRGYNQAHLLAKGLAEKLNINYQADALIRVRHTESQVGHSGNERRRNLRSAFTLNWAWPPCVEHIVLVDDVVTTGATVNEICRLLKSHGIKSIIVISVCLALPEH